MGWLWDAVAFISPAADVISKYTTSNAKADVLAGLTIGILLLPQAMAYAQLAHVPPIYGLYTSLMPSVLYAIFGGSHTMNLGTIALCGLLTGDIINDRIEDYTVQTDEAVAVALAVAFLTGAVLLAIGVLRFGHIVQSYLSPALIGGFHTGAAVHVAVSQLRYLLGTPRAAGITGALQLPRKVGFIASTIPDGNPVTVLVAAACGLFIWLMQKISAGNIKFWNPFRNRFAGEPLFVQWCSNNKAKKLRVPIPAELLAVIIFESISFSMDLNGNYDVFILGSVDNGYPQVRDLDWYLVGDLAKENYNDIFTIVLITLSLTLSDAKLHAEEANRSITVDREIIALSIANLISPFFGSYIAGAGISRSALASQFDSHGNLTQLYSIFATVVILIAIPLVGFIKALPQAVLGVIVMMALRNMFLKQLDKVAVFWKLGRESDFVIWLITFVTTVVIDLDWGLLVGLIVTVNTIFQILSRAKLESLGRAPGKTEYIGLQDGGIEEPDVKIVRIETALFFGSKDRFYEEINRYFFTPENADDKNTVHETLLDKSVLSYHTLVIDASSMIFIDVAGVSKILTLVRTLRKRGDTVVVFANASKSVRTSLCMGGFDKSYAASIQVFFESVSEAVLTASATRGIRSNAEATPARPFAGAIYGSTTNLSDLRERTDTDPKRQLFHDSGTTLCDDAPEPIWDEESKL